MEFQEGLIKELNQLPGVVMLKEDLSNYTLPLVGGAIITAMDNRFNSVKSQPKDYDLFCSASTSDLVKKGYTFVCETDNARTFTKKGYTFQFLKSSLNGIDFTISQVKFNIGKGSLEGDLFALEHRILIPTPQTDINLKFNQLYRIPHYQAKGFTIHPSTYKSLVESTHKLVGGREYLKCES